MNNVVKAARERRLVVFVGAGVSCVAPTCLPSWWDVNQYIVESLAHELRVVVEPERAGAWAKLIVERQRAERLPPEYQAQLLESRLRHAYFEVLRCLDSDRPNAVHRRIARLAQMGSLAAIVTTNFDRAIETAHGELGGTLRVAARPAEFADLAGESFDARGCCLVKLHGTVDDPSTLIDTLAQRKRGLSAAAVALLRELLHECHWLFLGWSGADLEADAGYLGLRMASADGRGFTWLNRAGTPRRKVVTDTAAKYGAARAEIVDGELPEWLSAATAELLPNDVSEVVDQESVARLQREARARVEEHTRRWAAGLGRSAAVECFAKILEATCEPQAAIELLRAALPASTEALREVSEAPMSSQLAELLRLRGEYDEASVNYERAIAACTKAGLTRNVMQLRGNMGLVYAARGDLDSARAAAEAVRDLAKSSGDDDALGVALHNIADALRNRGKHAEAETLYREELEIVQRLGDEPAEAIARSNLGLLLRSVDRLDESLAELESARRIQQRLGDDRRRAQVLGNVAFVHEKRAAWDEADRIYRQVLEVFSRLGDEPNRLETLCNLARVACERGKPEDAVRFATDARDGEARIGHNAKRIRAQTQLGQALFRAGKRPEGIECLRLTVTEARASDSFGALTDALLDLAYVLKLDGDRGGAKQAFTEVLSVARDEHNENGLAQALEFLATMASEDGELAEAKELYERAASIQERLGLLTALVKTRINMSDVALAAKRVDDAVANLELALRDADRLKLDVLAAHAAASLVFALGLRGRVADSLAAIEDAQQRATTPPARKYLAERLQNLETIYLQNRHVDAAAEFGFQARRFAR